jgi:hypothetical protein
MNKLAEELPEHKDLCKSAAGYFSKVVSNIWKMAELIGGYGRSEQQMQNLARTDVRQKTAALIDECKEADSKALDVLKQLVEAM